MQATKFRLRSIPDAGHVKTSADLPGFWVAFLPDWKILSDEQGWMRYFASEEEAVLALRERKEAA